MASMQVLGSLVTHVGSGVSYVVNSALETMALLVSKHAQELIPLSAHISGTACFLINLHFNDTFSFFRFNYFLFVLHFRHTGLFGGV